MILQEAYFVTEIVVGIAIITSVAFVALELRQNTYMLRNRWRISANNLNWLHETLCTDNDLETFIEKLILIGTKWMKMRDIWHIG